MSNETIGEQFAAAELRAKILQDSIALSVRKICKTLAKMSVGFGNRLIVLLFRQPHNNIVDFMHELKLYHGKNRLSGKEFSSLAKLVFPDVEFNKDNIEKYGNYEDCFPSVDDYEEIPCPF